MNTVVEQFFDTLAESLDYDKDALSLEARVLHGGPTVHPGKTNRRHKLKVLKSATIPGDSLPPAGYDALGSNHVEYQIKLTESEGDVEIPRTLYSWQLHPLPGNCGVCVNRWVQVLDGTPWDPDLLKAGLRLRTAIARYGGYRMLLITTGQSFRGAEPLSEYDKIQSIRGINVYTLKTSYGAGR